MTSLHEQRFIEGVVGNLALFREAEPAQVAAVSRQSWALPARRGDLLARRGERLPGLFVVAYGLAKLALRGKEGGERVLRLVGAGQTFGESTALLGRAAHYDALALADGKLIVIPSAPLFALMDREPRFGRAVARLLAERNFELMSEVEAVTVKRGVQRLAAYLAALVRGAAPAPFTVQLPVSKTLLAAILGIEKETLSRLLRDLVERRLIALSRGQVTILDPQGLGALR
jgi:CRP-like cAMP-binding protein